MTLDEFVELYEDSRKANVASQIMQKDVSNREVYETVVDAAEKRTGQNLRVVLDPNTGKKTKRQFNPYEIREFLDKWLVSSSARFGKYINANLQTVLKAVEDKKLEGLLEHIQPQAGKGYEEVSKLHEQYLAYSAVSRGLKSKDKEEREAAVDFARGDAQRVIRKMLENRNKELKGENKMSEEEMKMWQGTLEFVNYIPQNIAEEYEKEAEETFTELKAKLGGKIRAYLTANIEKAKDEEKAVFYDALYVTIKGDKKK